jgi:hypothetical protein
LCSSCPTRRSIFQGALFLGNPDGTFQPAINLPVGTDPIYMIAGDFNNDGKLDLVIGDYGLFPINPTTYLLFGNGDGTFQPPLNLNLTFFGPAVAGDFNGDGKLDLAVSYSDYVSIVLGNGNGTFGPPVTYFFGVNGNSGALAVADLNHDGKLDLAVINSISNVAALLGNGDGTFQPYHNYAAPQGSGIAIADMNGDGHPDLIVGTAVNSVIVLQGNGDGTFQRGLEWIVPGQSIGVAAADFNGDGKLDLALPIQSQSFVTVLTNTTK